MAARLPSFTHFLSSYDPSLLPLSNLGPLTGPGAADLIKNLPHGPTIVAVAPLPNAAVPAPPVDPPEDLGAVTPLPTLSRVSPAAGP